MKYTKYLINGDYIDLESLQTNKPPFKYPMRLMSIAVAIVGIATISGIIPMALIVDEYRRTKCRYIYFKRNGYRL